MATVSFTTLLPTAPSGFTAAATGPLSVKLSWNALQTGERCEVWRHTANDVTLASKVATVDNVVFTDTTFTVAGTYYYWLRTINQYDVVGAYDVGDTAGHSVAVTGVDTVNIVSSAVNNIAVVETPDVNIHNELTAWKDVENFTFVSGGYTTVIDSSLDSNNWSYSRPTYADSYYLYVKHLLIDETSGGVDTSTSKSTYGTFTYIDYGTAGQDFSNPTNVQAEDGVFCEGVVGTPGGLDDIYFYGYDFSSIPSTATLLGIEVKVKCKHTLVGTGTPTIGVYLCWDGANFSTDGGRYVSSGTYPVITTTTTNTLYTLGNAYYPNLVWGGRWDSYTAADYTDITIADIKNANFGVMLAANGTSALSGTTYHIDYVEVVIYYTTKDVIFTRDEPMLKLPGSFGTVIPTAGPVTVVADLTAGHTYRYITRVTGSDQGSTTGLDFYVTLQDITSIVREVKR